MSGIFSFNENFNKDEKTIFYSTFQCCPIPLVHLEVNSIDSNWEFDPAPFSHILAPKDQKFPGGKLGQLLLPLSLTSVDCTNGHELMTNVHMVCSENQSQIQCKAALHKESRPWSRFDQNFSPNGPRAGPKYKNGCHLSHVERPLDHKVEPYDKAFLRISKVKNFKEFQKVRISILRIFQAFENLRIFRK